MCAESTVLVAYCCNPVSYLKLKVFHDLFNLLLNRAPCFFFKIVEFRPPFTEIWKISRIYTPFFVIWCKHVKFRPRFAKCGKFSDFEPSIFLSLFKNIEFRHPFQSLENSVTAGHGKDAFCDLWIRSIPTLNSRQPLRRPYRLDIFTFSGATTDLICLWQPRCAL